LQENLTQPQSQGAAVSATAIRAVESADLPNHNDELDSDLEYLLALGGGHDGPDDGE
jgi:hypothetical protein